MWLDWLVFCDCDFQTVCPLMEKDKRLMELFDGNDLLRGKLGLVLLGRAMLSKSLIQFSVDGWSCVPSLLFTWPNYDGGNEDNGDLPQKIPCMYCYTQYPQPCSRPPLTLASISGSLPSKSSISLLSFSIRGQTVWKSQSQKTNQSNHIDHCFV